MHVLAGLSASRPLLGVQGRSARPGSSASISSSASSSASDAYALRHAVVAGCALGTLEHRIAERPTTTASRHVSGSGARRSARSISAPTADNAEPQGRCAHDPTRCAGGPLRDGDRALLATESRAASSTSMTWIACSALATGALAGAHTREQKSAGREDVVAVRFALDARRVLHPRLRSFAQQRDRAETSSRRQRNAASSPRSSHSGAGLGTVLKFASTDREARSRYAVKLHVSHVATESAAAA